MIASDRSYSASTSSRRNRERQSRYGELEEEVPKIRIEQRKERLSRVRRKAELRERLEPRERPGRGQTIGDALKDAMMNVGHGEPRARFFDTAAGRFR